MPNFLDKIDFGQSEIRVGDYLCKAIQTPNSPYEFEVAACVCEGDPETWKPRYLATKTKEMVLEEDFRRILILGFLLHKELMNYPTTGRREDI